MVVEVVIIDLDKVDLKPEYKGLSMSAVRPILRFATQVAALMGSARVIIVTAEQRQEIAGLKSD